VLGNCSHSDEALPGLLGGCPFTDHEHNGLRATDVPVALALLTQTGSTKRNSFLLLREKPGENLSDLFARSTSV
jgi:hypothetical protein